MATPAADDRNRTIVLAVVALSGVALAVARFIAYIDVVTDDGAGLSFQAALAWWSMWVAGVALIVYALMGRREGASLGMQDWTALLVGLLVLVLMPGNPLFAGEVNVSFNPFG